MGLDYTIVIPDNWNKINLSTDNITDIARDITDNFISISPDLESKRLILQKDVKDELSDAYKSGTHFVASYTEPTEEGMLSIFLTIQLLPTIDVEDDSDIFVELTDEYTRADASRPQGLEWQLIKLPQAGKALQTYGVEFISQAAMIVLRTLVPVKNGILSVKFYSPNIVIRDTLIELFDAMTQSLSINE